MAEENKTVSLSDLGLVEEKTPAEKAEEKLAATEKIKDVKTEQGVTIEVKKAPNINVEHTGPKKAIPRPEMEKSNNGDDEPVIIKDINSIAKNPTVDKRVVNPIEHTMSNLHELADKGIERTEKELTAPGGRIVKGKELYIKQKYELLMERAKKSKNLKKQIKFYENALDTDPACDDMTEYERHGYILYKVAHDESLGIDDQTFGLAKGMMKNERQSSADVTAKIDKMTNKETIDTTYDNEDRLILHESPAEDDNIPVVHRNTKKKQNEEEKEVVSTVMELDYEDENKEPEMEIGEDAADQSKELIALDNNEFDDDIPKEKKDPYMEEFGIPEAKYRDMQKNFLIEAAKIMNLEVNTAEMEDYEVQTRGISLNSALNMANIQVNKSIWPLQYTGIPIEMTPLSGNELAQFTDEINRSFQDERGNRKEPTVNQLRSIYSMLYRHIVTPGKPSFDSWLRQISANDFNSLLMAQYNAIFRDCNFITYHCPKKGCAKIFLEKKDIMDMIEFPNEKTEENFKKILNKDSTSTKLYRTEPVPINDTFAISFITPSIYSNNFEQAALSPEFKDQHRSIIWLMQVIDRVYLIDKQNKKFLPIDFGIVEKNLEKTVVRKVNALSRIFKTFTPDDRSIIFSEFSKIVANVGQDEIRYKIPATKCPLCGTEIEEEYTDPMGLLFTRAQLSIEVASIPALS